MKNFISWIAVSVQCCLVLSVYAGPVENRISIMKQAYHCDSAQAPFVRACQALDLSGKAVVPKETPFGGYRFIEVGYLKSGTGQYTRQLIVTKLSWSRNLHKKIYATNRLCAFYVTPNNQEETAIIEAAIKQLENGRRPTNNRAYQWALRFEIGEEHCKPIRLADDGKALVSLDGKWTLMKSGDADVLIAKAWGADKSDLVLMHQTRP